jgi:hypothetical protein
LRLFANDDVIATPRWEAEIVRTQKPFDVVIFDRVTVPALTQGNFILIDTVAPNLPIQLQGKILSPRVIAPLAKHAVTEGLSLGDLRVQEALRVAPAGDATVLARAVEGPLLLAMERGKLRLLFIGFDLAASDLPLRVAFPVLVHNALEWFQPQRVEFPAQSAQAGTPFALR